MPTLLATTRTKPATTATVDCDTCRSQMIHVTNATFACPNCGDSWSASWTPLQILDADLCALSMEHGDLIRAIEEEALRTEPVRGDPDHHLSLSLLIDLLPLPYYIHERMVTAWVAWRTELEEAIDTL